MVQRIPQYHTAALGYQLTHHGHVGQPGSSRLTVCLPAVPTHAHFDPEEMHLTIATTDRGVEPWTVHHRSVSQPTDLRVCAGSVRLVDRFGKTVRFFTFGGELHVEAGDVCTRCTLRSAVPIIPQQATDYAHRLLAAEAEALIAGRRAVWSRRHASMDSRLACAGAVELYAAALDVIRERIASYPPEARDDSVLELLRLIDASQRDLNYQTGTAEGGASLDDLL